MSCTDHWEDQQSRNGKENANYYSGILGFYRDNGKEHGNDHSIHRVQPPIWYARNSEEGSTVQIPEEVWAYAGHEQLPKEKSRCQALDPTLMGSTRTTTKRAPQIRGQLYYAMLRSYHGSLVNHLGDLPILFRTP